MLTNQNDTIASAVQFYHCQELSIETYEKCYLHDRTYMISIFTCLVLLQTAAKNQVMDNIHLIHALKFDNDSVDQIQGGPT